MAVAGLAVVVGGLAVAGSAVKVENRLGELKAEMSTMGGELKAEMVTMGGELKVEIAADQG